MLAETAYGKSRSGSSRCCAAATATTSRDLTVAVRFEGDYDESYTDGDNSDVLPTDTMKNTVYALAAREPWRAGGFGLCSRGTSSIATRGCGASAST